jgi:hypothetical protein
MGLGPETAGQLACWGWYPWCEVAILLTLLKSVCVEQHDYENARCLKAFFWQVSSHFPQVVLCVIISQNCRISRSENPYKQMRMFKQPQDNRGLIHDQPNFCLEYNNLWSPSGYVGELRVLWHCPPRSKHPIYWPVGGTILWVVLTDLDRLPLMYKLR